MCLLTTPSEWGQDLAKHWRASKVKRCQKQGQKANQKLLCLYFHTRSQPRTSEVKKDVLSHTHAQRFQNIPIHDKASPCTFYAAFPIEAVGYYHGRLSLSLTLISTAPLFPPPGHALSDGGGPRSIWALPNGDFPTSHLHKELPK